MYNLSALYHLLSLKVNPISFAFAFALSVVTTLLIYLSNFFLMITQSLFLQGALQLQYSQTNLLTSDKRFVKSLFFSRISSINCIFIDPIQILSILTTILTYSFPIHPMKLMFFYIVHF